jgi:hypothetical protein
VDFVWNTECDSAFQFLKSKLATDVLLAHPQRLAPFLLHCDASNHGTGAVLSQHDSDHVLRPVAFASQSFSTSERNYSVHDGELLAIVRAFRLWRHFLLGHPQVIQVHTDHRNLLCFRQNQPLSGRHARCFSLSVLIHLTPCSWHPQHSCRFIKQSTFC